jgi:DNA-binding NarL/FixJ family response regulator
MREDDGTVVAAVRARSRGYLLKGADQEEVVRALTTVANGGTVFGAALARRIAATPRPVAEDGAEQRVERAHQTPGHRPGPGDRPGAGGRTRAVNRWRGGRTVEA